MSERTQIEWADHTWSPWRGCAKVSPGCANCYAETLSKRNPKVLGSWGKGAPRVLAKNWGDPMRWQKRTAMDMPRPRVFPSLCDWLDEEVSPAWLAEFLALINLTPRLDWLLLTKRPENWRERIDAAALASTSFHQRWLVEWLGGTPPPNVWVGVSVEDQIRADERIPLLLEIPAALRWLSVEPMLGPVDLCHVETEEGSSLDSLTGDWGVEGRGHTGPKPERVDWVVIGGESGRKSRWCDVKWVRSVISECQLAGVPVFVKQLGSRPFRSWDGPPGSTIPEIAATIGIAWTLNHPKGGDPAEWTSDLRVREFPEPCGQEIAEPCFGGLRNEGDRP